MKICVDCKMELRCLKNGVGADFGSGHVYPGDLYICPRCKSQVLLCNAGPINDKDYNSQDLYVRVDEERQKLFTILEPVRELLLEIIGKTWEATK